MPLRSHVMAIVRVRDGGKLHVRVLGRGAPCVLVHGFASSGSAWLPFVTPLLGRYRFIVPDLRGFGGSRHAPLRGPCPLTTYAHDLGDLMEAFGLQNVPLVGISMGALSSVRCFELGHGRRFSRYMHIDQGLVIHNGDEAHGLLGVAQSAFFSRARAVLEAIDASRARTYAELTPELRAELGWVFAEFVEAAFTNPGVRKAAVRVARSPYLMPWFLPKEGFETHLSILRAYLEQRYDLRAAFAAIDVPTTVLIGAASRMYPAEGQRRMVELSTYVKLRELPGVGHMLALEAPRSFMRELEQFLEA